MFSPQFMGYIIDPKDTAKSTYNAKPPVCSDKEIKSEIAQIKGSRDILASLNKDVFEKLKNNVAKYDNLTKKAEVPRSFITFIRAVAGI